MATVLHWKYWNQYCARYRTFMKWKGFLSRSVFYNLNFRWLYCSPLSEFSKSSYVLALPIRALLTVLISVRERFPCPKWSATTPRKTSCCSVYATLEDLGVFRMDVVLLNSDEGEPRQSCGKKSRQMYEKLKT